MSHAEGTPVLSRAAAMQRIAETLSRADGLPPIDVTVAQHVEGDPVVIVESLDAYEWGHHLHLDWVADTLTGEVEFTGIVNGVRWSILYLPRTAPRATDWASPIHHTQVISA